MREIDYDQLIENYKSMINVLEYDSMRSAGKAKMNAQVLCSLHELLTIYVQKMNSQKASKKEAK